MFKPSILPYMPFIIVGIIAIGAIGVVLRLGMIPLLVILTGINIGVYIGASHLAYIYYHSAIKKEIIRENLFINPQGYAFMTALLNIMLLTLIYGFIFALERFGYLNSFVGVENFYGVFFNPMIFILIGLPLIIITLSTGLLGLYMYRNKVFENKNDPIKVLSVLRDFSVYYAISIYSICAIPIIGYYKLKYLDIQTDAINKILDTTDGKDKLNKCFTAIDKEKVRERRKAELKKQIDDLILKYKEEQVNSS